ncbi:VanH-AOV family D-lactate dehydrogenase [Amycolatopsis orientalis]|uniref:VanH-AOV family D-lactate dehydrogenase n=1 Tax=Amycolatopsis orientalis TaxID=31958 RepID=UPI002E22FF10
MIDNADDQACDHRVVAAPSSSLYRSVTYRWPIENHVRAGIGALLTLLGMTYSEPAPAADSRTRSLASASSSAVLAMGITIYGCGQDEAALFREMAPRFGVLPTIVDAPVSEANIDLVAGNRCISVGHKNRITNSTLRALSEAGVVYVSTRSIGFNHIDVDYAASVGITVGNVSYSPDSVADFTLMLMLMAIRNAKSIIRRADVHDYRLQDVRGKELRDLTVGVIGTGRIGVAVLQRLRGFGCEVLAYDKYPQADADYVALDELLRRSDIVTLHAPLDADTHHLLDRHKIEEMKHGAFVINTGRGALIETEALIAALDSGKLGGAALDVVEGEEGIFYADCSDKAIDSKPLLRLQELPNVLISPHTAYYTDHALSDTVENSIVNCLKFESGKQHG